MYAIYMLQHSEGSKIYPGSPYSQATGHCETSALNDRQMTLTHKAKRSPICIL